MNSFAQFWLRPSQWLGRRPLNLFLFRGAASMLSGGIFCSVAWVLAALTTPAWSNWDEWADPMNLIGAGTLELGLSLAAAALAWAATLSWIWGYSQYCRAICMGLALTVGTWLTVLVGCVLSNELLDGSRPLLMFLVALAAASTLVIHMELNHRRAAMRPLQRGNKPLALHCPGCNYSMVGLREARCPECGSVYTLEELVAAQNYAIPLEQAPPDGSVAAPG